jgi:hypothetical protein
MSFIKVVLPEPLGPMMIKKSPFSMLNERCLNTLRLAKEWLKLDVVIAGFIVPIFSKVG